jgi:hypothetical protein
MSFFKDYVPVLISVTTVIVSTAVAYTTYEFNSRASIAAERSATTAASDTLSKLITEFGTGSIKGVEGESEAQRENRISIAAMKIAVYGDQALLAVRMAVGSDDADLRRGGEQVAREMYLTGTVKPERLTAAMLSHYDNLVTRRGAMEWFVLMGTDLSDGDRKLVLQKLVQTFGQQGEHCETQSGSVALSAASFLQIHHFAESKDLALGLIENCPKTPEFEGACEASALALRKIAKELSPKDRDSIISRLKSFAPNASIGLQNALDDSISNILKNN